VPLNIKCPKCAKVFEILKSAIGSSVACPHCKSKFRTVARKSASGSSFRKSASSDAGQASGSHQVTAGSEPSILLKCPACGEIMSAPVKPARTMRYRVKVGQTATCQSCGKISLVGIPDFGGWLLLAALGLAFGLVGSIVILLTAVGDYGRVDLFAPLPALSIGVSIFTVFVGIVFFMMKPYAPKLVIALLVTNSILALMVAAAGGDGVEAAGAVVAAAVWVPYFLVSKRVKATFGRRGVARPIPEKDLIVSQGSGSATTAPKIETKADEGNTR